MDLFTVAAKLKLDSKDFVKEMRGAESSGKTFANTLENTFNKLKSAAKVAMGGFAVKKFVDSLVKPAVDAYANYEQLVGGVETLFGAKGAQTVEEYAAKVGKTVSQVGNEFAHLKEVEAKALQNADNAYKTAGMSANEYMETATSFSAALIAGLKGNTEAAADITDMAIQDMSDNANKMGTDISAIQNAYQGFAKQNYTMLDNLKLGYGGTKTEMERLLKDAQKLTGKKYNLKNLADVYKAIHVIQEQMGITGTTAEEASSTIQGSLGMLKASWENMLVAVSSGDKDVKAATKTLVDSGKTFLSNVVPAVKRSLSGIGTFLKEVAPMLGREIPGFIADLLPGFLGAGGNLIDGLITGLINGAKTMKWPSWDDIKQGAEDLWNTAKEKVSEYGGLIFGKTEDGKVNWPDFSTAVEWAKTNIWDKIVKGVAEFGGLVFGKKTNDDGSTSVNWPSFSKIYAYALAKWGKIKEYVANLGETVGALVFGKKTNTDGSESVNWPKLVGPDGVLTYAKDVIWEAIKGYVVSLGGLVFGKKGDGTVNWPKWEDEDGVPGVKTLAEAAWKKICEEAAKLTGFVFGDAADAASILASIEEKWTSLRTTIETKAINIGTYFFGSQNGETVAKSIKGVLDALVAFGTGFLAYKAVTGIQKIVESVEALFTLPSANPTAVTIGAIATAFMLIAQNWDTIQPVLEEGYKWLDENIFKPVTAFFEGIIKKIDDAIYAVRDFLGLTNREKMNGVTADWLEREYYYTRYAANNTEANYSEWNKKFTNALKELGYSEQEIQEFLKTFSDTNYDPKTVTKILEELQNADKEGQALKNVLDSIVGQYTATVNIDVNDPNGVLDTRTSSGPRRNRTVTGTATDDSMEAAPKAIGAWNIPYDNFPILAHKNEILMNATQAREYREGTGGGMDASALYGIVERAIREGIERANIVAKSYLNGRDITDEVARNMSDDVRAMRFRPV